MKMIKFALKRYANFGSHIAAFLAGFGCVINGWYFWVPLAVAVVLGSACAYFSRPKSAKKEQAVASALVSTMSEADLQSLFIQQLLSQIKGE